VTLAALRSTASIESEITLTLSVTARAAPGCYPDTLIGQVTATRLVFEHASLLQSGPHAVTPSLSSSPKHPIAHPHAYASVSQSRHRRTLCSGPRTLTSFPAIIASNPTLPFYGNDMDCSWLIAAPSFARVTLTFANFSTEPQPDGADIVTIYNGSSIAAPQVGQYSGQSLPPPTVLSPNALVTFTTDSQVVNTGFYATASFVCVGGLTTSITTAGSLIASSMGVNYQLNVDCRWTITAPAGHIVRVTYAYFATQSCCANLAVYSGLGVVAGNFARNIAGARATNFTEDYWQSVTLRFVSQNIGTPQAGFAGTVQFIGALMRVCVRVCVCVSVCACADVRALKLSGCAPSRIHPLSHSHCARARLRRPPSRAQRCRLPLQQHCQPGLVRSYLQWELYPLGDVRMRSKRVVGKPGLYP
jgi:hypothetical protein